jgi:hypothetical protein
LAKLAKVLSGYIDERELADQLHRDVRTIRTWRKQGKGPAYTMIGRSPYYRLEAVGQWLREREAIA